MQRKHQPVTGLREKETINTTCDFKNWGKERETMWKYVKKTLTCNREVEEKEKLCRNEQRKHCLKASFQR